MTDFRSRLLKILVVNWQDRLNPLAGGAETHLHEVFGRLAGWGHQVSLLTSGFPGGKSRETVDGMEVHRVGGRLTFGLRVPGYLRRALDPDAFHVVVEDLNKVPVFMPFWTRAPVTLLVHHLFGATAFQEASFPIAAATWLLERPVPRVFGNLPIVAVSQSTVDDLRMRGIRGGHIEVVPNGVDLDALSPDPEAGRFPEPTLVYLGRLKRYKRVDVILRAVGLLRANGVQVRFLVAGKGDQIDVLKQLATRLDLGDTVQFLGYVPDEEKTRLLQRSWVHVLTSPKEGWGISILEASACGTPSVASDSPGLRDAVRHGLTGLLTPHGDVEALARNLAALLGDPDQRERMGRAAREFSEGFSWESSARKMEAFLMDRVAAGHPRA